MASIRSRAQTGAAAQPVAAETPKHALAIVARHGMRIQIAAVSATTKAVAGWAHAAHQLVQAVGDEVLRRVEGETNSRELVVRVAGATNVHLRELAALPSAAADHFDARLSRVPIDN